LLLLAVAPGDAIAQVFTSLYSFNQTDAGPEGAPVPGPGGIFYGASGGGGSANLGTVFELQPPTSPGAAWTETTLYSFSGPDGATPLAMITLAPNGTIYGTTSAGGASNLGTVFQLVPPSFPGGAWTETVLHSFAEEPDGNQPLAPVSIGEGGVLYGTTGYGGKISAGTVFALRPPTGGGSAWTEEILHSFAYEQRGDGEKPISGTVIAKNGSLYGTTIGGGEYGDGAVFEVRPPAAAGQAWTESVIWSFNGADGDRPLAGLAPGAGGALYGTTSGGVAPNQANDGNVFELLPPTTDKGSWTESVICQFTGPNGDEPGTSILVSARGALYGTTASGTSSQGLIFKLSPPQSTGDSWTETILYSLNGVDGALPGQLVGVGGALYGYFFGGSDPVDGALFELQP
jgi:uncharacterized repeat protein (TIGR03803 family)